MRNARIEPGPRLLALLACGALFVATGCEPDDGAADPADAVVDSGVETDGGEGEGEGEGEVDSIDIAGAYIDDYDIPHVIDGEWTQGIDDTLSTTALTAVDNAARRAIGQNTADHPYAPDKWSRYDWTFADGRLWYCQPAFDADTAADAEGADAPDAADPALGGCNGFPWSGLTPAEPPAIVGAYSDDFDTAHAVTASGWQIGEGDEASRFVFTAVGATADGGWAVAYNDADNPFGAGLWSRFDWVTVDDALYQCQSAYDAPDAATARAASADTSAPAEGGCGGMFPWSRLTPVE